MKKILLLHGNCQTGELLLGRMDKLRKRLQKEAGIQLVAPSALLPHPDKAELRTWWNRNANAYEGLEMHFQMLQELWNDDDNSKEESSFVGIFGFSQGARLAHLMAVAHQRQPDVYFPGLRFVIMAAGYEAPLPDGFDTIVPARPLALATTIEQERIIAVRSLHVWGVADKLIRPDESKAQLCRYADPQVYEHEGGHHVPMKAPCVNAYMDFIESSIEQGHPSSSSTTRSQVETEPAVSSEQQLQQHLEPDEDTAELQRDEVEALTAIFPDEFTLLSRDHPITFRINLVASEEGIWPPQPIALEFKFPHDYPQCAYLPKIHLEHENNVMEFSSAQSDAVMDAILDAAKAEEGMPCVMSIVYAARAFFESGAMATTAAWTNAAIGGESIESNESLDDENDVDDEETSSSTPNALLRSASPERIQECNLQGLQIAVSLLREFAVATSNRSSDSGKGGHWTYTVGLVGKPSAGKSTFFNAATAFARQRDDKESALGGATMAPHPFTTIDPNIGFCLVPAPEGSCPEDDYIAGAGVAPSAKHLDVGCTHGRDNKGRRLIPVLLKDVAGLVPGAYQGRGRGNKFLNDLTDSDVLIHVLDASGTADVEGNDLGTEADGKPSSAASHPLSDMSWIRSELIEWVFSNLLHKWVTVKRKGREKLTGMLSGYGQTQWVTWKILDAVEKHLEQEEQRGHTLDQLDEWDEGDVHRLVSAFLGVRFPMALAMNKCDLPTSKVHVRDIQEALPIHGAFTAVPLSARSEMNFLRRHLEATLGIASTSKTDGDEKVPEGVWQCMQSAVTLREPVLVFPVLDFVDYTPLPGLCRHATGDPSLPSLGMIACLQAAGGSKPTLWDAQQGSYAVPSKNNKKTSSGGTAVAAALRDCLVMKPWSTAEGVFVVLKRLGALSGEFVRAEAAGAIGAPSRPIPKHQVMSKNDRIIKIMTSKRSAWQQNYK